MAAEIAEQPDALHGCSTTARRDRAIAAPTSTRDHRASRCSPRAARAITPRSTRKYLAEIQLGLAGRPGVAVDDDRLRRASRPAPTCCSSRSASPADRPTSSTRLAPARECGALTVAVTNNPSSPLADAAELGRRRARRRRARRRGDEDLHRRAARAAPAAGRRRGDGRRPGSCRSHPRDRCRRRRGRAVPLRRAADHHRARLLVPDRARSRAEADRDQLRVGAGVLRRRPAARPTGDDRRRRSR